MSDDTGTDLSQRTFGAVVFDVDGTLVDSRASLSRVWATWLAEHQVAPDPSVNVNGMTNRAIVSLCLPEAVGTRLENAILRVEQLELEQAHATTALAGAAAALKALADAPVAVATSAHETVARARLEAAGLAAPRVVVTGDDVEHGKPDPEIFRLAAERLGVEPAECLVVEDAPAGVAAARAGGFPVLAVLTTSAADELPADLVVEDLAEVGFTAQDGRVGIHRI